MAALNTGCIKSQLIELLRTAPSGKFSRELAAFVERDPSRVATRMAELQESKRVVAVNVGRRKLWFLPEYAENARKIAQDGGFDFSMGLRRSLPASVAMRPVTTRVAGEPVRTICPSGADHRFTVHNPEPFFSAMQPGSYMRTGSAIERAYGGGR